MLREVFRTEPIKYLLESEYTGGYLLGVHYDYVKAPYNESLNFLTGFMVQHPPTGGAAGDATTSSYIYVMTTNTVNYWPTFTAAYYVFDVLTGKFLRRVVQGNDLGTAFLVMREINPSRNGVIYAKNIYGNSLSTISLGNEAQALPGEDVPHENFSWSTIVQDAVQASTFGLGSFGAWAIDEQVGVLINGTDAVFGTFSVYSWPDGKFLYSQEFPDAIQAICLEDDSRCYILLANRQLILYDYMRGEVLGSAKIPKVQDTATSMMITWDKVYRRILVIEQTPDNPDGSCTTYVRGYQLVNLPERLTTPIPLKVPRQGRVIPVLVQAVDEYNHGVGGYVMTADVSGSGSLAAVPITDHRGDAFIPVACVGSPLFSPESPTDVTLPDGQGIVVPSIGKSCWVGWFEFEEALSYQPPANCMLWKTGNQEICDLDDNEFAKWVEVPEGGTVDNINAVVSGMEMPAVAYWNARLWPKYPDLRVNDWLAIQAYCRENEDPVSFEINMRVVLNAAPPTHPLCLVCQCFTTNPNYTTDLANLVPVYARLARDFPKITMILAFSDQGTPNGLNDHPEVKTYWEDLFAGVPSAPPLPTGPNTPVMRSVQSVALFEAFDVSSDTGSDDYAPVPPGEVKVKASVLVEGPATTQFTGVIGSGLPTGVSATGDPTPPGGGVDPNTGLPESAPNMKSVVDGVYASKKWDLSTDAGKGAFTEAAVVAIHDVNASFGFVRAAAGQPSFNGHTVNSVEYKNPDGTTGETFSLLQESFTWSNSRIVSSPDVSSWKETAVIQDVHFDGRTSYMTHSMGDTWPMLHPPGFNPKDNIQWTWWLFLWMGNQWIGAGFLEMWKGRTDSGDVPSSYHKDWYYGTGWDPMQNHGPIQPGEPISFMATSGDARHSLGPYGPMERSNVVTFNATDNGAASFLPPGASTSWTFTGRDAAGLAKWYFPA